MALRVWLPLNGNLDNQGLSNCTIANGGATIDNNGKIGKTYSFDANDDFISIDGDEIRNVFKGGSNPFTIAFWIYNTKATGARAVPFGDYGLTGTVQFNLELNSSAGNWNDDIRFFWVGNPDYRATGTSVTPNTWVHLAIVYDGTQIEFYRNGALVNTRTGTLATINKTSGVFYLGRDSRIGGTAFGGKINDFRVYDECLSPKQIKEISKGLVAHYKLDNLYIETTENLVPANIYNYTSVPGAFFSGVCDIVQFQGETCFSVTTVVNNYTDGFICQQTAACTEGEVYTYSGYIWIPEGYSWSVGMRMINGGGGYFHQTIVGNGQWQYFSQTFTANDNTSGMIQGYEAQKYDTAHTIYLKKLQLEKRSFPTAFAQGVREGQKYEKDTSGNNYDGTITGTLNYNQDSARYSGSIKFGGTCADYIYRPIFDFLTSPFTFNCWVYQTSATSPSSGNTGNTLQMIAGQGRDCGLAGFELCSANGYARLYLGTQTNGTYYTINDNTINLLNNWHMITGTFDGTIAKLYVDGVLKGTKESDIEPSWGQATGFVIGKMSYYYSNQSTAYFPFNGSISDAKVYATALSADDIKELYQTSALIDNQGNAYAYEFREE